MKSPLGLLAIVLTAALTLTACGDGGSQTTLPPAADAQAGAPDNADIASINASSSTMALTPGAANKVTISLTSGGQPLEGKRPGLLKITGSSGKSLDTTKATFAGGGDTISVIIANGSFEVGIVPEAGEKTISLELTDLLSGKTFPFTLDVAAGAGASTCPGNKVPTAAGNACECPSGTVDDGTGTDTCVTPAPATCTEGVEVNGACTCPDPKKILNSTGDDCVSCSGDKVANAAGDACECPSGTVEGSNDTCTQQPTPSQVQLVSIGGNSSTTTLPPNAQTALRFRLNDAAGQAITSAPTVNVSVTPAGAATIAGSPLTLDATNGEAEVTITPAAASAGTTITLAIADSGGAFSLTLAVPVAAVQPPGPVTCTGNEVLNGNTCEPCTGNQVPNDTHTACIACTGNQVSNGTNTACITCTGNEVPNTGNTACVACAGGKVNDGQGNCECPSTKPYFVNGQCTAVTCTGGDVVSGECTCTAPKVLNSAGNGCEIPTPDDARVVSVNGDTSPSAKLKPNENNTVEFSITSGGTGVPARQVSVTVASNSPGAATITDSPRTLDSNGKGSFTINPSTADTTLQLTLAAADTHGAFSLPLFLDVAAAADECAGVTGTPGNLTSASSGTTTLIERCAILKAHNDARAEVGVTRKLTWNTTLADNSYEYAKNCIWGHSKYNTTPYTYNGTQVGENLAFVGPNAATVADLVTPSQAVIDLYQQYGYEFEGWVTEKNYYNYAGNSCASGKQCGHYTQVVWSTTTEVGCGYHYCGSTTLGADPTFPAGTQAPGAGIIFVCQYAPPGNNGQKPY